ncbi:UDP-N-acetylmuramate dehydrogenase [Cerasicoccus fimbriatus]|uniref:UDP-N-acetylmuramate dehydrogenase n=1 Tax=Cerasicoccus fimbriatus TaxID=3014554 RepID=UPI0022B3D294|nr:UDP-N-acetylmuramate dehydrogenase [Cerasicoccus sp. TK19100]
MIKMMPEPTTSSLPDAVFMLGVGGMGMAPLAIYLAEAGVAVTGWDDGLRPEVATLLQRHGVQLSDELPESPKLVARSSAIGETHELYLEAKQRGARVLRRGELLAEIVAGKKLLAVVGSHGKSTTTGMLIHLLNQAGYDCGYLLGALFRDDSSPAHFSALSDWVIAEVDESDGTVEGFSPEITVAVNFDWDHADLYPKESDLRAAFSRLFSRTKSSVIIPEDCFVLNEIAPENKALRCHAAAGFNASNTALALAAARELGAEVTLGMLKGFAGIRRRQDVMYQAGEVTLVADYAHHPTEITALLQHARSEWPGRQIVVFQPHRFTRTRQFAAEFAKSLEIADEVFLLPVYAASESPLRDGASEAIVEKAGQDWPVLDAQQMCRAVENAMGDERPVTVMFVGAGDIDHLAHRFAADWRTTESWRNGLSPNTVLKLGEPLANKTTLRVGGPARFYAEPVDAEDLAQLINFARQSKLPWFVLGRGSNLIVADAGFDGLVISLKSDHFREFKPFDDGRIEVGAGLALKRLCGLAAKEGLGGFEFLEGIPGTVGGALRMNAGAMGGWMFDVVESVTYMTADGEIRERSCDEFHVEYRCCHELRDGMALSAVLKVGAQVEGDDIRQQMDAYAGKRKESQPREPSAGCIFKNPANDHAGKLIDELGLKGKRIGGAEVSTVHGNFIINREQAKASDVLALIREIRAVIKRERGIDLEPEALLVGQRWEDVL